MLYKLPTVIISRRTDQYSKAYENLMGQVPQQGIPRARVHALPKAPSGAVGSQVGPAIMATAAAAAAPSVSIIEMK